MIHLESKTKRATHISRGAWQNSKAGESACSPPREVGNIHNIIDRPLQEPMFAVFIRE